MFTKLAMTDVAVGNLPYDEYTAFVRKVGSALFKIAWEHLKQWQHADYEKHGPANTWRFAPTGGFDNYWLTGVAIAFTSPDKSRYTHGVFQCIHYVVKSEALWARAQNVVYDFSGSSIPTDHLRRQRLPGGKLALKLEADEDTSDMSAQKVAHRLWAAKIKQRLDAYLQSLPSLVQQPV